MIDDDDDDDDDDDECRQQKRTKHAPSAKMECDYFYDWIKKRSHTQQSHR